MSERVNKGELIQSRNVIEELRRAFEREQRAEQRFVEDLEQLISDRYDDEYEPAKVMKTLNGWPPPRQVTPDLRQKAIWQLGNLTKVLDGILASNTIRLYEMQIPPNVHGSIGDISQFEINLDPQE